MRAPKILLIFEFASAVFADTPWVAKEITGPTSIYVTPAAPVSSIAATSATFTVTSSAKPN